MLNPFKKKENNYSLDQMTLPTLNDTQPSPGLQSLDSQSNSFDSNPMQMNSPDFNQPQESPDLSTHPALSDSPDNMQLAQENPFKEQSSFPAMDPINTPTSFSEPTPSMSFNETTPQNNLPNDSQSNSELNKIQLETLDKKMSLLDTRMSVMEDKIEKIYQMISMEVRPETKMKVDMRK